MAELAPNWENTKVSVSNHVRCPHACTERSDLIFCCQKLRMLVFKHFSLWLIHGQQGTATEIGKRVSMIQRGHSQLYSEPIEAQPLHTTRQDPQVHRQRGNNGSWRALVQLSCNHRSQVHRHIGCCMCLKRKMINDSPEMLLVTKADLRVLRH